MNESHKARNFFVKKFIVFFYVILMQVFALLNCIKCQRFLMAICEDESLNVGDERPRQESHTLPVATHSGIVDWKVAVFVRNVNESTVF